MDASITLLCKAIRDQSDAMRMLIETVENLQKDVGTLHNRVLMLEDLLDIAPTAIAGEIEKRLPKCEEPSTEVYLQHIMQGCNKPECTWCND